MDASKTKVFLSYNVYLNIFEYIKHRKLTTKDEILSKPDFISHINHYEFKKIMVEKNLIIILIKDGSMFAKATANFNKLIKREIGKSNKNTEVIVVMNETPSSFIENSVKTFVKNNVKLSILHYDIFKIVLPNCVIIPKHEILQEENVQLLLDYIKKPRGCLPKIKQTDPMCVWMGAKKNNVIKITRHSISTGESIGYRVVI